MVSGRLGMVNESCSECGSRKVGSKPKVSRKVWSNFGTRIEVNSSKHVKTLSLIDMPV